MMNILRADSYNFNFLFRRFIAFFIDWYLSGVLLSFPVIVFLKKANKDTQILNLRLISFDKACIALILASFIYFIYHLLIPYLTNGQTIGKKICKIKIVSNSRKKINLKDLFLRQFLGAILIEGSLYNLSPLLWQVILYKRSDIHNVLLYVYYVISIISILVLILSKKAIHDYIAKTNVRSIKDEF